MKRTTKMLLVVFALAIYATGYYTPAILSHDETTQTELTSDLLVPSDDAQRQFLNLMTDLHYDDRKIKLQQVPIADLRLIILTYEDGLEEDRFVHKNSVDKFVEASMELHYQPGINPHNGGRAGKITRISVAKPDISGPYWWSTPGLQQNYDPEGVPIIDWYDSDVIWELASS